MTATVSLRKALRHALREDFLVFLERSFRHLHPSAPYHSNWHHAAIAWRLARVQKEGGVRLIVNVPPRSLKSVTISVAWVAWMLGRDPRLKFVCVSYSGELALKHARDCRELMRSSWYREAFPAACLLRDAEHDFTTTLGGGRLSTSVGGTVTGRGGDIIVIDDPIKPDQGTSEAARTMVNEWYRNTLASRLDDQAKGSIVLVMQRVHEDDLSGVLLEAGGWDLLRLPALAEADETIPVGEGRTYRRLEGRPLDARRQPAEHLAQLRETLGSPVFSAQYQQAPVPAEGVIIKADWLRRYDVLPERQPSDLIVQSWDCASKTGAMNDYSVCITALIRGRSLFIVDVLRRKMEFPTLLKTAIEQARVHAAETLLIEDAASGAQLIQTLRKDEPANVPRPLGRTPSGDKVSRLSGASARVEAGEVLLPREALWLATFERELLGFPHGRHDDQVDAFSQLLEWARERTGTFVTLCGGYTSDQPLEWLWREPTPEEIADYGLDEPFEY